MEEIHITKNREETINLGKGFVTFAKVVALYGELGSGKTTFVQGLARGLGIKKRIISPTFVIIREYKVKSQKSKVKSSIQKLKVFYHIDLYRIESEKEVEGLGLEEVLNEPQNLVVIEWAEKMSKLLPKKRIDIYFEYLEENKRKIRILR